MKLQTVVMMVAAACATTGMAQTCTPRWVEVGVQTDGPAAREGHGLTYLGGNVGRVFMFGGSNFQGTTYNDLWSFDGERWELEAAGGAASNIRPAGRRLAHVGTLTDPFSGLPTLFVFGGALANGTISNEVWTWNRGRGWLRHPDGPITLWNGAISQSPGNRVVIFGGAITNCNQLSTNYYSVSWTGANPTFNLVQSDPGLRRWGFDATLGFVQNSFFGIGGDSSCTFGPGSVAVAGDPNFGRYNLGFALRNNAALSATAYNGNAAVQVVNFGGNFLAFPNGLNDIYQVNFGAGWVNQDVPRPSARIVAGGMAYDESRRIHVMFGGYGPNNSVLRDTWVLAYAPYIRSQTTQAFGGTGSAGEMTVIPDDIAGTQVQWFFGNTPISTGPTPWGSTRQVTSTSLLVLNAKCEDAGTYSARLSNTCEAGFTTSDPITLFVAGCCDSIDFNRNGVFPEDQDLVDLLSVLAGGPCPYAGPCDLDFNNDGVFPDDRDVQAYLSVLAGGTCQ